MRTIPRFVYVTCIFSIIACLAYKYGNDRIKKIISELLIWFIVLCIIVVLIVVCSGAFNFAMTAGG